MRAANYRHLHPCLLPWFWQLIGGAAHVQELHHTPSARARGADNQLLNRGPGLREHIRVLPPGLPMMIRSLRRGSWRRDSVMRHPTRPQRERRRRPSATDPSGSGRGSAPLSLLPLPIIRMCGVASLAGRLPHLGLLLRTEHGRGRDSCLTRYFFKARP
jgi:hypothetical protein